MGWVIATTPRSGSSYMTRLLRCTGIRAGHEDVYHPTGYRGWNDWEVDVTPWAPPTTDSVLQVRHPLRVIASLAATEALNHITTVEAAAAYWLEFMEQWFPVVEFVYRVEDLDVKYYKTILQHLYPERRWLSDHLAAALAYVPVGYNSHSHDSLDWSEVPGEVKVLGTELGY